MIIDCHSHIACSKAVPMSFFDGWIRNIESNAPRELTPPQSKGLQLLFQRLNNDPLCDQYIDEMNAAGIDKAVLLIIDFAYSYQDEFDDLESVYQHHAEVAARHPGRFIVFAGIDPNRGRAGLDLFEKSIRDYGFAGLKIYPPCGFSPSDPRLFDYYEICSHYQLPVLTHVGPTTPALSFKYSWPIEVDDAARLFPKVNFILGHAGSVLYEEASVLAEYRPNVFLDMSGFQSELRRKRFTDILQWHKSKGLLRKILFGTDWPIHRFYGNQTDWVNAFHKAVEDKILTTEELDWIFYKNSKALLNLN
ncbi:amidohydrolase family protein [Pseudomonas sp. J452]|uniref:amidohydrolase family protein n=1 Tax=Pseudomonas sp. J452 TaxID=2898441 RepID=UPI0021ADC57B|nr:amidohydrolase family protein [Pseudomonas sp. J452]UUY08385.1 amidohydrolase family protein [Pseudomonas sp. J452]